MAGILVQLLLSFILLKGVEHKNLNALGLTPTKKRMLHFAIGCFSAIIYFTILFLLLAFVGHNPYRINPQYSVSHFFKGISYIFLSVAFETLIFNGALLYILIKRLGTLKAVLISAVAFGVYHWFSWNLFGQPVAMAYVFFTTGIAGYLWALAFARTGSVYLPFALHFGVDIAFSILFSKDKSIGPQLLVPAFTADPHTPGTLVSIVVMLLYFAGFPALTFLYLQSLKKEGLSQG